MDKEIIVIGSLEPHKAIQDQARVIGGGGICPTIRARDYKGAIKVLIENGQEQSIRNDKEVWKQK